MGRPGWWPLCPGSGPWSTQCFTLNLSTGAQVECGLQAPAALCWWHDGAGGRAHTGTVCAVSCVGSCRPSCTSGLGMQQAPAQCTGGLQEKLAQVPLWSGSCVW